MPGKTTQEINLEIFLVKILSALQNIENLLERITELLEEESAEGIIETYSRTATTQRGTIAAPIDGETGKRKKWMWVQILNDSETTSVKVGVNVGSVNPIEVKPLESQRIDFGNKKKIEFVNFQTESGTAPIRIICAR